MRLISHIQVVMLETENIDMVDLLTGDNEEHEDMSTSWKGQVTESGSLSLVFSVEAMMHATLWRERWYRQGSSKTLRLSRIKVHMDKGQHELNSSPACYS